MYNLHIKFTCLLKKNYLFIYLFIFQLCQVFVAEHRLSLIAASRDYSSLWCIGFSLPWLLLLRSMGSRHVGFSSCGLWAQQLWLLGSRAQAQQLWHTGLVALWQKIHMPLSVQFKEFWSVYTVVQTSLQSSFKAFHHVQLISQACLQSISTSTLSFRQSLVQFLSLQICFYGNGM